MDQEEFFKKMHIVGKEEVNTGRQTELDIAKGLAVIFMVLCHAVITLSSETDSVWYFLGDSVLGGPPAAPVFMICLGIGVCYSRHSDPAEMAQRGLKLIGIAYVLNFVRDVLPYLIWAGADGTISADELLVKLLDVDILQFAGVVFIVLAAVKKIHMPPLVLLAVSVVCNIAGHAMSGLSTGNLLADGLLGIIWPTGDVTSFPFLNWLIFPAFGICFGKLLRRCTNKKRFYLYTFLAGGIMAASYLLFGNWSFSENGFYHLGIVQAVCFTGISLMIFAFDFVLIKVLSPVVLRFFAFTSKAVNTIYCIHWVIIGWIYIFVCEALDVNDMKASFAMMLGIVIFIVSAVLAKWWLDFKAKRLKRKAE